MITIGAFEAKTHLSTLLERVAAGEEVLITKHGKPIARLIGAQRADQARADAAFDKLKQLRKGCTLGGLSWKELRDTGAPVTVVIDASVALSWCFEDEASAATDALFERVRDEGAVVPGLWHLELANVLLQAEKRGRIETGDVTLRLELITDLPIATDQETTTRAWREILSLARGERLTAYDATYLELAVRLGVPLATRDAELAAAGRRMSLTVLP